MKQFESVDHLYADIKRLLHEKNYTVNPYRRISYGIQFLIFKQKASELLRVYEGKKGLRVDFSQVKNVAFLNSLKTDLADVLAAKITDNFPNDPNEKDVERYQTSVKDPEDVIGVDESGKGDYFGPLVVAAVHVDPERQESLAGLGIADSKTLTDTTVAYLADLIAARCPHTFLIIGNEDYNVLYEKFKNLNHMLAWVHMKVIENILKQGYCPNALCDQFGNASLLKNALRSKQIDVTLYQRPKAESNIAVACASILARHHFVDQIKKMGHHYSYNFPKGCSDKTIDAAQVFMETYGKEELRSVAKLHFKLTDQIEARIKNKHL